MNVSVIFPITRRGLFFAACAFSVVSFAPGSFIKSSFAQAPEVKRTVLARHETTAPDFEAVLVQVDFPVGSREGRHTHPGLLIIHVDQGTLSLESEGKPATDYKAGDSVVVEAGKIHEGINKGSTPIKVIATFVIPKGATLTAPAK